jgi:3-carboxy-cis,cis-muconate cycloisomerase
VHARAAAIRMAGLVASLHGAALGEHERALGGWQAELAIVPEIAGALGTGLDFLDVLATSLVIDAARMAENLAAFAPGPPPDDCARAADALLAELAPYLS